MGNPQQEIKINSEMGKRQVLTSNELLIIHHNVQSLRNKLLELIVLLNTEFIDLDILCFSEHWLNDEEIRTLNIEHYKLVDNFSRISRSGGGSCIWIRKDLQVREVSYLRNMGS
jgi:hypothetical protein